MAAPRSNVALGVWNALVFLTWAVVPFVLAGARWWPGWVHAGVLGASVLGQALHVRARNPELRHARRTIGAGTPSWDLAWNAAFFPLLATVTIVAAADARARGATLPWPAMVPGALLLGASFAVGALAMAANRHFEGTVRIQRERDHRVVDAGPYRVVRHPGYLALCLWALATPAVLRSARALIPAAVTVAWIVLRTALEDAFLRRELDGYAAYARRVRRRLLPGVW
jgi:protein-S-isoprenylcysteine O-methyltransferase Ste14